jgi:SAM-dependent methyltransferase
MSLSARAAFVLSNPRAIIAAIARRSAGFATRRYEVFLGWLLRRPAAQGAVWHALCADTEWTPQPNLTVGAEILRRVRAIPDPQGANRYLPHRWRMIFNEIRTLTAKDVVWAAGPVFLSFGAGDRHPMGLPLLAVLAGASKGIALEPGALRDELTTATLQETLWDVVRDPAAYGLTAADLGRLRTALDADALWRGDPLPTVLSKGCLELSRSAGEKADLAPGSIDIVYSRSVLEHVIEVEAAMVELVRALRPGGIMFHDIGLDAHDVRDPIGFYYAERGRAADAYSGLNFWRLGDFVALFERLGCKVEIASTETVPQGRIDRTRLISRFAGYSDEDLQTIGAKLLVRKPH